MPKNRGIQLNDGDVIEVLKYIGLWQKYNYKQTNGFMRVKTDWADDNTRKVTITGWHEAIGQEIHIDKLKAAVCQFVEERIKLIAEAKFEGAIIEFE